VKLKLTSSVLFLFLGLTPVGAPAQANAPAQERTTRIQYGVASWYGESNQGRWMASGVRFNEYAMVAAHPTLPMGTQVEVTNLRNGRSAIVRIMDRGPYVAGRVIDLSKEAAARLHFVQRGVTPVKIRVLSAHGKNAPEPSVADGTHLDRGGFAGGSSGGE
jgi:rare lipoprotein A